MPLPQGVDDMRGVNILYLVVPDQAVLAVQVMLVQRDPVGDEAHGARPRACKYQGSVLIEFRLRRGRRIVAGRPASVLGEGNVRLRSSSTF